MVSEVPQTLSSWTPVSRQESSRRECSGLTTRGILIYVERAGGRPAVDAVLERTALDRPESELRDEDAWFPDTVRVRLFEAAAAVLDDPEVARRVGESALDLGVGQTLKIALRALGSPRLLYGAIPRINDKFNLAHPMDLLELGSGRARIRRVPRPGVDHHPCDCQYNSGLFECVPGLFGEPPARVRHDVCIGEGAEECIYEVRWSSLPGDARALTGVVATTAGAAAATALVQPAALRLALAGAGAGLALRSFLATGRARRRMRMLEREATSELESAERLRLSLQNIASDLRGDEVLQKVTAEARAAVGGAEFAFLVLEDHGILRSRSSSNLPPETLQSLEGWAASQPRLLERAVVVDALDAVPELVTLVDHAGAALRSLCAAPVRYRDETIGILIALSGGRQAFLPRDADQLQAYATHAAIAVTNARLYGAQEALASRDPLTGLHNHREFHEAMARELERCRREGGTLSVALFDLDGFKLVNDTRGHAEGDRALKRVAEALNDVSRSPDLAFRIGGDEFAVVLPGATTEALSAVAERIAAAVYRHAGLAVSFGVASWPNDGLTKDETLVAADQRLYADKPAVAPETRLPTERSPASARREYLASIGRLATRLGPLTDSGEIADATVRELDHMFAYLLSAVFVVDGGDHLVPIAWAGRLADEVGDFGAWRQRLDEGVNGRAVRNGEPILITDTATGPALPGISTPFHGRSELAVPIRVGGDVWGVLNLAEPAAGAFDGDDLLFATTVAGAVGTLIDRGRLVGELEGTFLTTLEVLADALEAKDPYTAAHAYRVADLTEAVGRRMGVSAEHLPKLRYGGLLHDVGKIGIRSELLQKPDGLTASEAAEVKEHTLIGAAMLSRIPNLADVSGLVRAAHEAWDGSGYPDGLAGETIPLEARIIAACDAYHAMVSDRPYRPAMPDASARAELRACSGGQFDPKVVTALNEFLESESPGGGLSGRASTAPGREAPAGI